MPKISFNAQALGITSYDKRCNVGHAETRSAQVAVVRTAPSIQSLFEGLGFTNVESFPVPRDDLPTEDVDP
jgi:superfamily I DNA and RNA helicase